MKKKPEIVLFIFILLFWTLNVQAEELHLRVLDVGEGQAILLHRNKHAIMIDTGHAGVAGQVVKRMHELQVEKLDYLILTHLHPDHASGFFRIHEAYPQAVVADNCYPVHELTTPDMLRWTAQSLQQIENRQCLEAGITIDWMGAKISVLWPLSRPAEKTDINGSSLILHVSYRNKAMLLMGDAGYEAEKTLLKKNRLATVDILVVGHHGADDATSEDFLATVQPGKAVISTNKNNFRGYPSRTVLKRLETRNIEVYKTYEEGELHFVF